MDVGGMESYIMNMYRRIDRTKVQFDFLVHHARRGVFEDEIEALGGQVYHTTLMDDFNLLKYLRDLNRLYSRHPEYRIVHGHLNSSAFFYLGAARRHGIRHRILHCHCPGKINTLKGQVKHLVSRLAPVHATLRLACSTQAGRYLYKDRPFELIANGVDAARFRFTPDVRREQRRSLGFQDQFVIGHVGRFYYEKNHEYLLNIFKAVRSRIPQAVLMLLGDGKLMNDIRRKAHEMALDDAVFFMGLIRDTAPYYQAMDVFCMPSLYEGLPLTGLEAQFASLPCVFSDTVSQEVSFSPETQFLPIGPEHTGRWADALENIYRRNVDRSAFAPYNQSFDAAAAAEEMIRRYETLWESEK